MANETTIPAKARGSIGRPKAATVKTRWISFRVTAEEHFQLLDKAQRSGLSPGEFARSRALRGVVRAKKGPPETQPVFGEATREVYHELRRQGVLLNQIAHHCNTHKIPPPPEMSALSATIMALWQKLLTP
ncbi:MAG: plasmid mobilization protein [Hyphomonadaceae bacterium]